MPLILKSKINENLAAGHLGLWRIQESETELTGNLELAVAEQAQLNGIMGEGRRKEFLAARHLLHLMSGRDLRGALVKDEHGKPHLDGSDHHISISHTDSLSAAVAHPRACGIDVQIFVSKIGRLAPRFTGAGEEKQLTDANRLIFQHLIWSAKEAMYKAYGRREVDFRENLFVDLSGIPLEQGTTRGRLCKEALAFDYRIDYQIFERNYMLVTAVAEE
jgi:phosphopantetheinyl transferase